MVLINPQLELGKERELGVEGCLSFPDITADISRSVEVHARAQLLDGRTIEFDATGLLARALQHEVDHLNGILFIDRIEDYKRNELRPELKKIKKLNKKS